MTSFSYEKHPFWDFSLKIYGNDGVPAACLALQDRRIIDVNILLFNAWIGESGSGVLTASEQETVLATTEDWCRDIVCEIRALRNRLKGGMPPIPTERSDVLRKMILDVEVKSEHLEQMAMAAAVKRKADPTRSEEQRGDDAVANIAAYFRSHGFTPDAEDARQVAIILGPAFPQTGRTALAEKFAEAATG